MRLPEIKNKTTDRELGEVKITFRGLTIADYDNMALVELLTQKYTFFQQRAEDKSLSETERAESERKAVAKDTEIFNVIVEILANAMLSIDGSEVENSIDEKVDWLKSLSIVDTQDLVTLAFELKNLMGEEKPKEVEPVNNKKKQGV